MTLVDTYRDLSHELDALHSTDPVGLRDRLSQQHTSLRFDSIDIDATWKLGTLIRDAAVELFLPVAIHISLGEQTVFHAALPGASADNDAWARRKAAVADRYLESSLAVGLAFAEQGGFDAVSRLPLGEYAAHGGAVPLLLASGLSVGHAAVSGLPAVHDHALVVAALMHLLQ